MENKDFAYQHVKFAMHDKLTGNYTLAVSHMRLALSFINKMKKSPEKTLLRSQWFKAFNQLKRQAKS